ncbi:MAG: hypothetical protein ACFCA4_00580 [Cyanophyceae cyanobacterium]
MMLSRDVQPETRSPKLLAADSTNLRERHGAAADHGARDRLR